jgi:hypothetical protein
MSLPLRGVRTTAPRGSGSDGTAMSGGTAMPGEPRCVEEPPCPEGAKQVSPGQSEAAQLPSAALGKRPHPTFVALKGRNKRAANERRTRHKRTKSCVEMIRMPELHGTWPIRWHSFCPSKPANRGHPFTSGSQLFVIASRSRSCRVPSGRWILGGPCYPGRRVASAPRCSAPYCSRRQ